ncbi:sine oculis-binding protein homolog B [Anopheles nili]|uniref:sine oculis-binding protein homolog B n=1 Tax=Anopheles nili TaxID=185578 RepID=UPI00237B5A6A|nr:sine oculis-binding protein homolog B [Anopheles nili]
MATASPSASTSPPRIKVKKELCTENDAIKELAETAMNDILGWYGYDSVDRLELATNSLASTSATLDEDGRLRPDSDIISKTKASNSTSSKHFHARQHSPTGGHFHVRHQDDPANPLPSTSAGCDRRSATHGRPGAPVTPPATNTGPLTTTTTPSPTSTIRNGIVLHHQAHHHHGGGVTGAGESSTSEKDSSRESSKSPMLMKMLDKQEQTCQWCRKVIPSHQAGILGTTEGMIFCTEACFSQSRRASFKRAKTCDWCRHVRHAVSYVDFQDGASQLQFCSDKCLNQYKMQIFCNETQAHLEMNPHLKEKSTSAGSLITPELWMKNCKSCSMSPISDRSESVSPVPSIPIRSSPEPSPVALHSPTPAKKPLISVAPPSKLLSKSLQPSPLGRPSPKGSRKRRPGQRPTQSAQHSGSKRAATGHQTEYGGVGSINNNNLTIPNNNLAGSPSAASSVSGPVKSCPVMSPSVQDLRILQKKHNPVVSLGGTAGPSMVGFDGRTHETSGPALGPPPPPPPAPLNIPPQFLPPPLNLLRAPFFPMNPAQLRFGGVPNPQPGPPGPMGPPPSPLGPGNRPPVPNLLGLGGAPPVTILVPYPIIVPLPLPIPVPIPVIDFLRAALPKDATKEPTVVKRQEQRTTQEEPMATKPTVDSDETVVEDLCPQESELDVPLDFTVGGAGKLQDRDAVSNERSDTWSEPEVGSVPSYVLATVEAGPNQSNDDTGHPAGLTSESGKQLLPRYKLTRVELGKPPTGSADGSNTERPLDEEDIERERKEMVERSRPLRKRKRLVVQQHLQTDQLLLHDHPANEGVGEESELPVLHRSTPAEQE